MFLLIIKNENFMNLIFHFNMNIILCVICEIISYFCFVFVEYFSLNF